MKLDLLTLALMHAKTHKALISIWAKKIEVKKQPSR